MKSNTIKISDEANKKIKILMARNDLNFSEAVEHLTMFIQTTPTISASKVDIKLSTIQMQAINIVEYTQEIKESDSLPTISYYDYVLMGTGLIKNDLEEIRQ